MIKLKAPRIYHLPWSEVVSKDDKFIRNKYMFRDKNVVVTLKLDGMNMSLYNDGSFYAKSLDSNKHASRDWLHSWWSTRLYSNTYAMSINIRWPELRLVGENMYGTYTIKYNNLEDLFLLHSAWNGITCLSWQDTLYIANCLGITTVPLVYEGAYNENKVKIHNTLDTYNDDLVEGYVVRNSDEYSYMDSDNNIAKFVSKRFELVNNKHWYYTSIEKNDLVKCN